VTPLLLRQQSQKSRFVGAAFFIHASFHTAQYKTTKLTTISSFEKKDMFLKKRRHVFEKFVK